MSSEKQIEQEIQDKGLTAPRVTPADIEANIADVEIVKHTSKSGQVLRWAVLTTSNGFAVVGKPSCAVSSANDNAELGEQIAIANSKEDMWPLMGYALKQRLHEANQIPVDANFVGGLTSDGTIEPVAAGSRFGGSTESEFRTSAKDSGI